MGADFSFMRPEESCGDAPASQFFLPSGRWHPWTSRADRQRTMGVEALTARMRHSQGLRPGGSRHQDGLGTAEGRNAHRLGIPMARLKIPGEDSVQLCLPPVQRTAFTMWRFVSKTDREAQIYGGSKRSTKRVLLHESGLDFWKTSEQRPGQAWGTGIRVQDAIPHARGRRIKTMSASVEKAR
jgi:hypothetical protein